jgi:hypothetical protein
MFPKSSLVLLVALAAQVLGRERWMERSGRALRFHPRRFGQEHPAVIDKLSAACPGQVCGSLAGGAITPLLAAQGECTQQDFADSIIGTYACLRVPGVALITRCRRRAAVRRRDEADHDPACGRVPPGREEHAACG